MPAADQAQLRCRGPADVDHAVAMKRPAVVDPHGNAFPAAGVGHLDQRAERQRAMRRGQRMHVEALAAGRAAAMKTAPVVGCHTHTQRARSGRDLDRWFDRRKIDDDRTSL